MQPQNPVTGEMAQQNMQNCRESERGFYTTAYSGRKFHFNEAKPGDFDLGDIAHSLGMMCRFNGHVEHFYSVAEHSWWVSHMVPREFALQGLMHDAIEAYITDIVSPMKWHIDAMTGGLLANMERKAAAALFAQFGIPHPYDPAVKEADRRMLVTEMQQLRTAAANDLSGWTDIPPPYTLRLECWSPIRAKHEFLSRFQYLNAVRLAPRAR